MRRAKGAKIQTNEIREKVKALVKEYWEGREKEPDAGRKSPCR